MATYTLLDIRNIIARNLGEGRVLIELNSEHYDRAIDAALKMMARYRPEYGYQVIQLVVGGNKTEFKAKNLNTILEVTPFTNGQRFEEAPYYTRWVDRSAELGDMRDTQRAFGDEFAWEVNKEVDPVTEEEKTYIYTHFTRSTFLDTFLHLPVRGAVQFTWYIEPTDESDVGVKRIPYDMRQWFEEYATALCREILGEVRNKFSGVPGATDGSLLPNDGGSQINRAIQDKERLESDLKKRQRQLPLIWA